jgi:hypothetical protein
MSAENRIYKPECGSCTLGLVQLAYIKSFWFKAFREPLVFGMRVMARWHGIDARRYQVNHSRCNGCVRFMKNELKAKSPAFRALNFLVNPVFNRLRDSLVTAEEKSEAKRFAAEFVPKDGSVHGECGRGANPHTVS